jgi:hypothetical protein
MLVGTTVNGANFSDNSLGSVSEKSNNLSITHTVTDADGKATNDVDYQVGDKVWYSDTITAPNMTGYDVSNYAFAPMVTLSSGLEWNAADATVTINGTAIDVSSLTTINSDNTVNINLSSLVANGTIVEGSAIGLRYSTTVTTSAITSTPASIKPMSAGIKVNYTKDVESNATYQSTEVVDNVYSYKASFSDVDVVDHSTVVSGATFTASRNGTDLKFTKLSDGAYVVDPTGSDTITSDANGKFTIAGLDASAYVFTQTSAGSDHITAPTGTSATLTIASTIQDGTLSDVTSSGSAPIWFFTAASDVSGTFYNVPKLTSIPATGGIGLLIFVLAIAAGVFAWRKSKNQ